MNRVVDCRASRGLSMVELLVALALGLIITAAVLQMFLASKTTYRMQEALARVQENGRFAIGQLADDIRMAGYMGCRNIDRMELNVIADPPPGVIFSRSNLIGGADNVGASNDWGALVGTDVLEIRRASRNGIRLTGTLPPDNANIKIDTNPFGFDRGHIVFITDCSSGDVFKVNNNVGNNAPYTLVHSNGSNRDNKLSKVYGYDAEIMAFEWITYFVKMRVSDGGVPVPALFVRLNLNDPSDSDGVSSQEYELVEGVENMQLEYGVDSSGDRAADVYRTASAVTSNNEWSKVVSVRVSLLMASSEEKVAPTSGAGAQALTYNDSSVTADGRLRQVFGTVVTIRNRAP